MKNTKFRIAKYYGEFDEANFEYYQGMTLDGDVVEPAKIIAEFGTEEEARNELKAYENDFRKYSSFYGVFEYIIEEITYDEDGDIDDVEYIDTAKVDDSSTQAYIRDLLSVYGELVDLVKENENSTNIKPVYKAKGNYYISRDFINIEDLNDHEDTSGLLDYVDEYISDNSLLDDLEEYRY